MRHGYILPVKNRMVNDFLCFIDRICSARTREIVFTLRKFRAFAASVSIGIRKKLWGIVLQCRRKSLLLKGRIRSKAGTAQFYGSPAFGGIAADVNICRAREPNVWIRARHALTAGDPCSNQNVKHLGIPDTTNETSLAKNNCAATNDPTGVRPQPARALRIPTALSE
jgi:hypothetical protein